ncbi:MAG: hypothetical protein N3D11_08060 [Candidatus Sumerlaeia bacterium]|nr:hypothetical protein [Candidatus Sumerlaeia bacterium]
MASIDRKILLLFVAIALAARLACLNLNAAEYTDGILQIIAFQYGFTFWPPLYTALIQALKGAVGDAETAGKLISIAASALLVIPVYWTAFRLGGRRASVYASLLLMANALAWRWSIRVMSDALFVVLFFSSAVLYWAGVCGLRDLPAGDEKSRRLRENMLYAAMVFGSFLGALGGITRFQGVLSLVMFGGVLILAIRWRKRTSSPNRLTAAAVVAIALYVVIWSIGFRASLFGGHTKQIAERAGAGLGASLLNYWNLIESFVLLFPYFITVPVFVLCLLGLITLLKGDFGMRVFGLVFLAIAAALIAMQAVFSAYQERYLLPLIPFMMVMGGVAAARWEQSAVGRLRWVRAALCLILFYSLGWSLAVIWLQRGAFGDIKQAAQYCASLPPDARIFSNEFYKPEMPAVKMSYWSGRKVEGLDDSARLVKGDYVCLHSCYGGLSPVPTLVAPMLRFERQIELLRQRYDVSEAAWFESSLVPLLPDIMENPDTHQNPAAWFYRYTPQRFRTVIFRIEGMRSAQ